MDKYVEKTIGDTICRVHKTRDFTMLSNRFIGSTNISCQAIALLAMVMGLPENWNFTVMGLKVITNVGETAVRNILKELESLGYLVRTQLKSNESKNHGFEYIYEFFEIALSKEDAEKKSEKTRKSAKKVVKDLFSKKSKKTASKTAKKQDSGFRSAENPNTENPQAEKQAQINTNEKIQKNQKLSYQESIRPSAQQKSLGQSFNKPTVEKSEDERLMERYSRESEIYTDIIKQNIDFYELGEWLDCSCDGEEDGWQEAEEIVSAIVRQIVSNKPYELIHGQKYPREIVKSVMLKLNIYHVQNVIEQMKEVLNIRNYEAYLISSLYNEVISYNFKKNAESRAIGYDIKHRYGF